MAKKEKKVVAPVKKQSEAEKIRQELDRQLEDLNREQARKIKETRKKEDIESFLRVQKGILDYYEEYLDLCPVSERKISKNLDEIMLSLIHNIIINDRDFLNLVIEDPFFNRMTNITDVI